AHSLPARIVEQGDRYDQRLLESCRLVADGALLPPWEFAYQSASATGEPWLGPDLLQAVERSGARRVLVCPIGFVADHLEILSDSLPRLALQLRGAVARDPALHLFGLALDLVLHESPHLLMVVDTALTSYDMSANSDCAPGHEITQSKSHCYCASIA